MSSLPADLPSDFGSALAVLNAKDRLDVEGLKLMATVECAGEPFYLGLAECVSIPEAQKLLRENAREETAHAHRVKKAIEILTGAPYELPTLAENPYASPPAFPEVTPELLEGIRAGELAGDVSYQRFADSEPNPEVAELLRQNGREEVRHSNRVEQVIALLRGA